MGRGRRNTPRDDDDTLCRVPTDQTYHILLWIHDQYYGHPTEFRTLFSCVGVK